MARISDEEYRRLHNSIVDHAFLHRILRHIEHQHRVVFHAENLDWDYVRASAEEILMANIITRYRGNIDGVYFALRKAEDAGRPWQSAITDYATYTHTYYTTPLGVILRRDLFGETSHFVTPAAGPDSALHTDGATAD